jgi:DNA-directed RNA polymerase subunit beta'
MRQEKVAKEYEQQYQDGLITKGEKYNKVVDIWSKCTDDVSDAMMKHISDVKEVGLNSVYMMAHSGARGSRGADPSACGDAWFDGETIR